MGQASQIPSMALAAAGCVAASFVSKDQVLTIRQSTSENTILWHPVISLEATSEKAYLRARLYSGQLKEEQIQILGTSADWGEDSYYNEQDGYCYFTKVVHPGEVRPLMIKLCLPGEAELPEEFQVELLVEVVQASSLGLKVDAKCRTTGWILEDGE